MINILKPKYSTYEEAAKHSHDPREFLDRLFLKLGMEKFKLYEEYGVKMPGEDVLKERLIYAKLLIIEVAKEVEKISGYRLKGIEFTDTPNTVSFSEVQGILQYDVGDGNIVVFKV